MSEKKVFIKVINYLTIFALLFTFLVPIHSFAAPVYEKDLKGFDVKKLLEKAKQVNPQIFTKEDLVYISPYINVKSNSPIRVLVQFKQDPVAVKQFAAHTEGFSAQSAGVLAEQAIQTSKAEFVKSLKTLGIKGKITSSYKTVFSGVALELPANQVPLLAKAKHVKAVYPNLTYKAIPVADPKPLMSESGPFIGSRDLWNLGYRGEGVKVGVIDTGIDYLHPDLAPVYKGGYDFVDNDNDPYETPPDPNDPEAATSHGTHVAGTIAAQHVQDNGEWGIAPGVELYAYRVLGPGGSGTTENVINGIERAVQDGMDVINLSLGADVNEPDNPETVAINNAMLAGTVAVVANGNAGPDRWTVGTPATAAFAISVGASTPPGDRPLATGAATVNQATYTYDLRVMAYDPTQDYQTELLNKPLELVYVGLAKPEEVAGVDLTGKIAFIQRGEIPFVDKIANVKAQGAVAAIIFNNVSGHINYYLGDSISYIPTFDMTKEDGEALLTAIQAGIKPLLVPMPEGSEPSDAAPIYQPAGVEKILPVNPEQIQPVEPKKALPITPQGDKSQSVKAQALPEHPTSEPVTFTITGFGNERYLGDEMASFSSRGPVKKTLDIKPDVVAPGVSIRSTIAAYGGDYSNAYERYQGTSMATPHVAGLAALIRQAHPEFTPFEVKAALMNTAKVIGDPSTAAYNVLSQGAGRVQGLEAVTTPVLAKVLDKTTFTVDGTPTEFDNITGSLNFGHAPLDQPFVGTKTIELKDLSGSGHTYTASVQFSNADTAGVTFTVDQPSVTVDAYGSVQVKATVNVDNTIAQQGEYQGYLTFTNEAGKSVHLPFIIYVGDIDMPKGFGMVFQDPTDFSPNGDGKIDTTDIYFQVYSQMTEQALLVWDPIAYDQGYNDGYIGIILDWTGEDVAPPGFWYLPGYDGTYYDFRTGSVELLRDGYYTLDWYGWDESTPANDPYIVWSDLYVDTAAPLVVTGSSFYSAMDNEATVTGTIYDMYIDFEEPEKVSLTYTLTDPYGNQVATGKVDHSIDQPGQFSLHLANLPKGTSQLTLNASDIAGNEGSTTVAISNELTVAAYIEPVTDEVYFGGTYQVTLVADDVYNLVGAQFAVSYDNTVFTLSDVKATDEFLSGQGGNGVVYPDRKDVIDGKITKSLVGVAYKDEVDGLSGNVPVLTLTFTVKDQGTPGNYSLGLHDVLFVDKDQNEIYPSTLAGSTVHVGYTPKPVNGSFIAEALQGSNIDYSTIGAFAYAKGYDGSYYEGKILSDGTVNFALPAGIVYDLELVLPGHFRSVVTGVEVDPQATAPISVHFGTLLAGDINHDDVIDIWDVVAVARYYLKNSSYENWDKAKQGDLNLDNQVDLLDLNYVVTNFGSINEHVPTVKGKPVLQLPEGFDLTNLQE